MTQKDEITKDAMLIHAAMRGMWAPCAIGLGLTVDEAYQRTEKLKEAPKAYRNAVVRKVMAMEK